jgi:hypothetical protein
MKVDTEVPAFVSEFRLDRVKWIRTEEMRPHGPRNEVYEGLLVQDNISNMAHIMGGIVGAIAGYTLNKK